MNGMGGSREIKWRKTVIFGHARIVKMACLIEFE